MNAQALDSLKMNLIVDITHLNDEASLRQISDTVSEVKKNLTVKQKEILEKITKPMRKKTTVEDLKREQNWKPIDREKFDRLIRELDIQEPLEQLIADIGK